MDGVLCVGTIKMILIGRHSFFIYKHPVGYFCYDGRDRAISLASTCPLLGCYGDIIAWGTDASSDGDSRGVNKNSKPLESEGFPARSA